MPVDKIVDKKTIRIFQKMWEKVERYGKKCIILYR